MIISIATPSYNQGSFIEETIKSVISQSGNFYLDYIIRDGKSTDNSIDIIKKYEDLLKANCDMAHLNGLDFYVNRPAEKPFIDCSGISYRWISEKDKGHADAVNKGFNIAKGEVLAFLNSDDIYYPGCLKAVMMNMKNCDVLYGKGMWIDEAGKILLPYPTFKPTKSNLFYQCTLCQPAVFISKGFFIRNGSFSLSHTGLDYEYWLRALFNNAKFRSINRLLAKSRMYWKNKTLNDQFSVNQDIQSIKSMYYSENLNMQNIRYLISERVMSYKIKKYGIVKKGRLVERIS